MNNKRTVQKLSSVIDLLNHDSLRLMGKSSIRVRYDYDGLKQKQSFTLLSGDVPRESADHIISWLNNNVTSEDIIYGLNSNEIDAETFRSQIKAS